MIKGAKVSKIEVNNNCISVPKIKSKECRFVLHIDKKIGGKDAHLIKELVTFEDGSTVPNLRIVYDYKRPFYITKPIFQNHKDKKETEEIQRLNKYESTESDLANTVAQKLGKRGYRRNLMRDVNDSPFVYGTDIKSSTFIKRDYQTKWPDVSTPYSVCCLDIENDVMTKEISVSSVLMGDTIYGFVNSKFIKKPKGARERIKKLFDEHIANNPDINEFKTYKLELKFLKNELDTIKEMFKQVHSLQPDYLSIWNMDYDIPHIISRIEFNGGNPIDIFSDPRVPKALRIFEYKQGAKQRVTESKTTPISYENRWHILFSTSSFYVIDAMTSYVQIRTGQAKESAGYGLDAISNKETKGKVHKLKIGNPPEGLSKVDLHKWQSENEFEEYCVYNFGDIVVMDVVDDKTKDLQITLPLLAGVSGFEIFHQGPKRIIDSMYFYNLERNRIISSKHNKNDPDKILGLDQWIVTLVAYRRVENGLKILQNQVHLPTNISIHVYDSDIEGAYPSATCAANVSKDTTVCELLKVGNYNKEDFKHNNMNLLLGRGNVLNYCSDMMNFPDPFIIAKEIKDMLATQ